MSTIDSQPRDQPETVHLDLSRNALTVLKDRYLRRDDDGHVVETPSEMFRRVARTVADVEKAWDATPQECQDTAEKFYRLMTGRRFLPNSPTLMNAGRRLGMLSACFVLPLEDSIEDIMSTARQIALVQRAGGGTGVDLSRLRPKGSIVRSSGGTTDGPLSFLRMLSSVTEAIQQGAFRRGANMGVMRIDHPDILAFIDVKAGPAGLSNYNLSVAMTDAFMDALRADPDAIHTVVNPHTGQSGALLKVDDTAEYGDGPSSGKGDEYYTVREVWERIVRRAWESGDPGLVFLDEINRHNPTPHLGPFRATNPCGEQPLLPYEACNLGSINLTAFCDNGSDDSRHSHHSHHSLHSLYSLRIDWQGLRETVVQAVRFLDNVIEVNQYPTREIHEATRATRKIGLGVMGFADLLFRLGIPYDSDDALAVAERIGVFIRETAWETSEQLAAVRGTFPAWEGSVWETVHEAKPMRNAHVVTIAPTGTISIIANCSSGIEPVFSLAFGRQVLGGKKLTEVNPVFREVLERAIGDEAEVRRIVEYAAVCGTVQGLGGFPERWKAVFRTARDISPEWHVRMQAAWQRHTDAAVSKTVNLPSDASVADVDTAFRLAHELKCKGITVYRDGARTHQPMVLTGKSTDRDEAENPRSVRPRKLPEVLPSLRLRQPTPFGNMHLHISVDPETGRECEVFAQLGKGGDLANSDLEAICRLVSLLLRLDGDLEMVIDQLEGIGSSLSVPTREGRIKSLGDGLARALEKYLTLKRKNGLNTVLSGRVPALDSPDTSESSATVANQESLFKIKCPDCNAAGTLAFEEGCLKCHACGYSIC